MNPNHLLTPQPPASLAAAPAPVAGEDLPHLVFEVAAQPYACPISKIQHLIRLVDVTGQPAPAGAPVWETGRLALTDDPAGLPVVSLRILWGFPPWSGPANQDQQAVLIVEIADRPYALLVDGCRSVIPQLPPGQPRFQLPAALQDTRGRAFKLATPLKQSLLVVLDLDEIFEAATSPALRPAPCS